MMKRFLSVLGCQRLLKCATLASILQLILLASTFNSRVAQVQATLSPEMAVGAGDGSSELMDVGASSGAGYEEKRSWQSLQGPWGKRALAAGAWSADPNEVDDEVFLAEHWPMPVLVTNAATLERLASQRQAADGMAGVRFNDDLLTSMEDLEGSNGIDKRTWKNINAAWGKRRNAPAWNKFSGAWGKREPGWNNLKGMWGKRASKDWQKLHGGWGKRAQSFAGSN